MKRILLSVLAILAGTVVVSAQEIRDIGIEVYVFKDGSARVAQFWEAVVTDGTEMYLPISNLDRMSISNFDVVEYGNYYENEGFNWDVNRTLEEKRNRCGIVDKGRDGIELCWGKGSYGEHAWVVEYTVSGLVQSCSDADGFNFMFVNPGMNPAPQHVKLTVINATGGPEWTYDNTRVWGFGSNGNIEVTDLGTIVYESTEPFTLKSSVITVVRFDKGMLSPAVSREESFEEILDRAMKGSSYEEEDRERTFLTWLIGLLLGGGLFATIRALVLTAMGKKYKKSMYGKTKITEWYRETPVEGNLLAASYILDHGWRFTGPSSSKNLIGAFFLKWILDGIVKLQPDPKNDKRVNLALSPDPGFSADAEASLYRMALEASGDNMLLEAREFEKWSEKHYQQMMAWPDRAKAAGKSYLVGRQFFQHGNTTTQEGAVEACHVVEFKNFLQDFTLSKEREAMEVGLWKDYLVFAQLYGIADKVAAQFQKLYPREFEELSQNTGVNTTQMIRTIRMNQSVSTAAMNRAVGKYTSRSAKGLGGGTSFGGGGGFSGGGFGGGSR